PVAVAHLGEAAAVGADPDGAVAVGPERVDRPLSELGRAAALEAVAAQTAHAAELLPAGRSFLHADPEDAARVFGERPHGVGGEAVLARERAELAAGHANEAAAARRDPQAARAVFVEAAHEVRLERRRVRFVERGEADAVEAEDAVLGA